MRIPGAGPMGHEPGTHSGGGSRGAPFEPGRGGLMLSSREARLRLIAAASLLLMVNISLAVGHGVPERGFSIDDLTPTPPEAPVEPPPEQDDVVEQIHVIAPLDDPEAVEAVAAAPGALIEISPDIYTTGPEPLPQVRPIGSPSANDPARRRFEALFPDQAAATQDIYLPDTTRWALLMGVNIHSGYTRNNVGSRQDAEELRKYLLSMGWRDDHIVLLTDRIASRENLEQGIAWLARKTNGDSVAAFHYSGHTKQWWGVDVDGDGESPDEGLWPSDNNRMVDGEFVRRMAAVNAGQLWVNIGACEAQGYADPGLRRKGRVLTLSSREDEKSYEDPSVSNSVWGYYMIDQALLGGLGDANVDREVTVEEAFDYGARRAAMRTAGQARGPQNGVMYDDLTGAFSFKIPPPPPRPAPPADTGTTGGSTDVTTGDATSGTAGGLLTTTGGGTSGGSTGDSTGGGSGGSTGPIGTSGTGECLVLCASGVDP